MTIQEKIDEINRRLFLLDGLSEIVIWGAGVHTLKLFEKTKLLSYNIGNIVDIDESKQGEQYFGYVVKKPSDIYWGGGKCSGHFRIWPEFPNYKFVG